MRELFLHYGETPTDTVAAPLAEADAAPETLADPADAPAAQEPPTTRRRPTARPRGETGGRPASIAGIPDDASSPRAPLSP